jgi:hypothetical protein
MKIAICLSGSLRNLSKSLKSIRDISLNGNIKIFIHTWIFKDEENLKKQRSIQKDDDLSFLFNKCWPDDKLTCKI